MSEPTAPKYTTPLPPASVDITELRSTVDAAASTAGGRQRGRTTVFESIALVLIVVAVVAATAPLDDRIAVALGGIVLLIGVALIFVVPTQLARRRSAATADDVAGVVDDAVDRVMRQLASIGYAVPPEVAFDWVTSPDPSATVPLVHDSVIAARWWRPAERDDRVFVEAIVRREGVDSALPVLPPL